MKSSTKVFIGILIVVIIGFFIIQLTSNTNSNLVPESETDINVGATINFNNGETMAVSKIIDKGNDESGAYFVTKGYPDNKVRFEEINYLVTNIGKYDSFAQCLTDSGVKMYGAYWCPHCKDQKKAFGNSFKKVNYVECDARGDNANPQACESAGIRGYPTWIFADGTRASGNQPLSQLSQRSGCALPE